jgi:hypothetical protein
MRVNPGVRRGFQVFCEKWLLGRIEAINAQRRNVMKVRLSGRPDTSACVAQAEVHTQGCMPKPEDRSVPVPAGFGVTGVLTVGLSAADTSPVADVSVTLSAVCFTVSLATA